MIEETEEDLFACLHTVSSIATETEQTIADFIDLGFI